MFYIVKRKTNDLEPNLLADTFTKQSSFSLVSTVNSFNPKRQHFSTDVEKSLYYLLRMSKLEDKFLIGKAYTRYKIIEEELFAASMSYVTVEERTLYNSTT